MRYTLDCASSKAPNKARTRLGVRPAFSGVYRGSLFVTKYGTRYTMFLSPADLAECYTSVLDKLRQIGEHYFANGQLDRSLQVLAAGHHLVSVPDLPSLPTAEFLITYGFILIWHASLTTGAYAHSLEVLH